MTYDLPLPIPAGRLGMTPPIGLSYDSGGGDSIVGVGWSLDGLSAIHRVTTDRGILFDGQDRYALPTR